MLDGLVVTGCPAVCEKCISECDCGGKGWDLYNEGTSREGIQRCDTCKRFESDEAAQLAAQRAARPADAPPASVTGSKEVPATPQTTGVVSSPPDAAALRDALLDFERWFGDTTSSKDPGDAKAIAAYELIREAALYQMIDGMLQGGLR